MAKPGPKAYLDDHKKVQQMRRWVIQGNNDVQLAKLSGLSEKTLYKWRCENHKGFRDLYNTWKHERMLAKAEGNIEEFLEMKNDKDTLRVKADMSKFVAETLGREVYAKKTEGDSNVLNLIAIENAVINIANGERKPLYAGRVGEDQATRIDPLQGREGSTIDIDEDSVHNVRSDIQALLSQGESDGAHPLRQESSSGTSDSNESSDVPGEVGDSSGESGEG